MLCVRKPRRLYQIEAEKVGDQPPLLRIHTSNERYEFKDGVGRWIDRTYRAWQRR